MTVAVVQRDMLMPRPPQGMGPGLMLALLVHGLLVVAIAFSVRWRASEPTGVTAELWSSVPEFAAPRVEPPPQPVPVAKPEPPPPPPAVKAEPQPDAQIAIEKAKREEAERRKKEEADKLAEQRRRDEELAEKRKKDEAEKLAEKRKEEQAQKLADERRKKNIERMMAEAGTGDPSDSGKSDRTAGPGATYAGRIVARIKPHINFPPDLLNGNPQAEVEIRLGADGTILSSRLVKSSGSAAYDNALLNAVTDTKVLPLDNGRNWSPITVSFRPRD